MNRMRPNEHYGKFNRIDFNNIKNHNNNKNNGINQQQKQTCPETILISRQYSIFLIYFIYGNHFVYETASHEQFEFRFHSHLFRFGPKPIISNIIQLQLFCHYRIPMIPSSTKRAAHFVSADQSFCFCHLSALRRKFFHSVLPVLPIPHVCSNFNWEATMVLISFVSLVFRWIRATIQYELRLTHFSRELSLPNFSNGTHAFEESSRVCNDFLFDRENVRLCVWLFSWVPSICTFRNFHFISMGSPNLFYDFY